MSVAGASEQIRAAVLAWQGMAAAPHRFGGVEFMLGKREIGYLHGDHLLDVPFPRRVKDELAAAGLAKPHHILPESGWISFRIAAPGDIDAAIALLRRSYELIAAQLARRKAQGEAVRATERT
jgi:predicted DNA-binding protein (MmcQ/YjbR family)